MLRLIILQMFLVLLILSEFIYANDVILNPLTVISTRLDENILYTPKNITIITSDQIERSPAKTIPELLSLEAGIQSRSLFGNSAVRCTIYIRVFGSSSTQNTLILLDGRRLNDIDLSAINYAAMHSQHIVRLYTIRGFDGLVSVFVLFLLNTFALYLITQRDVLRVSVFLFLVLLFPFERRFINYFLLLSYQLYIYPVVLCCVQSILIAAFFILATVL